MGRGMAAFGFAAAALAAVWLAARLIFPLPSVEDRDTASAIPLDPGSALGPTARRAMTAHPGLTGIVALADGEQALKSRLDLIAAAEASIDAQYYIWHEDDSGLLLLDALRAAALRGVRVRLLLDDNGIAAGMDRLLGALDGLPTFEVRIFNPSTIRQPKWAGYLIHPLRMNRRMHNKALIVDGAAAIVGGRNIGDEYFSMGNGGQYLDLDVLGVGQVVPDTAAVFDAYWNARAAIGIARLRNAPAPDPAAFEAELSRARASERARSLGTASPSASAALSHGAQPAEWSRVEVLADPPDKVLGGAEDNALLFNRLREVLLGTRRSLDVVSAYFVPGEQGTRTLEQLEAEGRRVRVMTNSLLATDVPLVHAGYAKRRRDLLEAGVALFEVLPIDGAPQGREELGPLGISGTSLHAKTFVVDEQRLFVGSFNFDPRSVWLNCEMGFLVHSPALARTAGAAFAASLARHSLRPVLGGDGVVWRQTRPDGSVTVHAEEPGSDWQSRALITALGWLPIEWLL